MLRYDYYYDFTCSGPLVDTYTYQGGFRDTNRDVNPYGTCADSYFGEANGYTEKVVCNTKPSPMMNNMKGGNM